MSDVKPSLFSSKVLFDNFDAKNHQNNSNIATSVLDKHFVKEDEFCVNNSPMQEFYKDQTVFITGATGFLGSLLVEKLLRCCPQICKLILLVRRKDSTSVEQRVKDYFSDEIFDKMRLANPNYQEKVDIVCGQLDEDNLGLDSNDEQFLILQTTVVFHIAATVRFDEHIRTAYNINVKGTETMLALAKRMPRLTSFVHISTAFCNCDRQLIGEVFYPPTFTANELSTLVRSCSDEEIAILNAILLGRKPNTYTLTKATSEELVREVVHELPICVFRPSIVFPTLEEPLPIWTKGFNGALAFMVIYAIGLMRVHLSDLDTVTDIVPADRTINAMVALAWYQTTQDTSETSQTTLNSNKEDTSPYEDNLQVPFSNKKDLKEPSRSKNEDSKVFNYISYNDNKITQREFLEIAGKHLEESRESCSKQLWTRHAYFTNDERVFLVLFLIIHFIPALVFSLAEKLTHRKPMVLKIYRKIFFFFPSITYFSLRQWRFENRNTCSMVDAMAPQDLNRFNASMSGFRWESILINLHRSVAFYLLGERLTKEYYDEKIIYIEWVDFGVWTAVYVVAGYCALAFVANQVNLYYGLS